MRNCAAGPGWSGHFRRGRVHWFAVLALFGLAPALAAEDLARAELCLSVESPAVVRMGPAAVGQTDFAAFLDLNVPEEHQVGVLSSADRIGQILQQLLLTYRMADLAIETGLFTEAFNARLFLILQGELREEFRRSFVRERELPDYTAQARELFLTQPQRFMGPETVSFRHILITVSADRSEAEAMGLVLETLDRLAAGEDFQDVAQGISEDQFSRDNGGLLEQIELNSLVSQVASVLAEATVGQISDPVRSRFGWHIVELVEQHDPVVLEWSEAADHARELARNTHLTTALERLLRELQSDQLEFPPDAIKNLLAPYGVSLAPGLDERSVSDAFSADQ